MTYSNQPPPPDQSGYRAPQAAPQGYAVPPAAYGFPGSHPGAPPRPTHPVAPSGQPLAAFGERLLARLIDTVLTTAVVLGISLPLLLWLFFAFRDAVAVDADGYAAGPSAELMIAFVAVQLGLLLIAIAFAYVYEVELTKRSGQTVGKRVMKIRVVPLNPAVRVNRGVMAKRFLISGVAVQFVPLLGLLDGLWQLWDQPFRQCLHDKFAQTVVVRGGRP